MAPQTPGAWLSYLLPKLAAQQKEIRLFEDYYNGDHRLSFATATWRRTFGALFSTLSDNWCRSVVDAPVERLQVTGFKFDGSTSSDARLVWQANNLDAGSAMLHTEAVKDGMAAIMVAPGEQDRNVPQVTVEHGMQVYVETAPGNRRHRLAAIKRWRDENGYTRVNVYDERYVYKWISREKARPGQTPEQQVRSLRTLEAGTPHSFDEVPVFPALNNPTMMGGGQSDLLPAIPLQDAINKTLADMLVSSEFAGYPQRVLMGVEIPTDPLTGQPTEQAELTAAQRRFWALEDPNAKIGEFSAADLKNYTEAIKTLLQHLAAQTRTPPHYLLGEIVNASGDALKAAEVGLVAKVKRKQIDFGEAWEDAMRLALRSMGKSRLADDVGAETEWADCEYRSEGERVDAAIKLKEVGVPLEFIWARLGYSGADIEEMKRLAGLPDRPPPGATTAEASATPNPNGNGVTPAEKAVEDAPQTS